jgi:hypothetical protein
LNRNSLVEVYYLSKDYFFLRYENENHVPVPPRPTGTGTKYEYPMALPARCPISRSCANLAI